MLFSHTTVAVRASSEARQAPTRVRQRAPAPDVVAPLPSSRRTLLAGAGSVLFVTRVAPPAQAAPAAPAPQRAAAAPTKPAATPAATPAAAPARTGPPMAGPPQSLLALSYAAVAGLGLLFVSQQGKPQGTEFSTAFPAAEAPSPLAAVLTPPSSAALASGIAAADKWRADAAKEYESRAINARKRQLESEWFAAYNEKLRSDVALKAQVSRSAANQVQRNAAVRAKARSEAADQDVAPSAKKRGILSGIASLLPFRKKK